MYHNKAGEFSSLLLSILVQLAIDDIIYVLAILAYISAVSRTVLVTVSHNMYVIY